MSTTSVTVSARQDTRVWEPIKPYGTRLRRQAGTDIYKSTVQISPGRESAKSFRARNATEARNFHEKRRVDAHAGNEIPTHQTRMDDLAEDFFAVYEGLVASGERAATTLERYRLQYRKHLKRHFGAMKVQAIRPEHVSRWLAHLRRSGLRDITSLYQLLGVLLNHGVTRGLLVDTPLRRISKTERPRQRAQSEPRRLSDDECSQLIAHALPTYRVLIAVLAFTGLRQSEALGLTWEDIDLEAGVLHVRHQLERKKRDSPVRRLPLKTRGSRRQVDLLAELVTLLRQHKAEAFARGHARRESFVFCTETGQPQYYRNVAARGLDKAANAAGLNSSELLPKLTMHDLRHTAISRWIAAGLDVVEVSRLAGHADPSITLRIYAGEFARSKRQDEIRSKLAAGTSIRLG